MLYRGLLRGNNGYKVYRGLQGVTKDYKGLEGVTKSNRG